MRIVESGVYGDGLITIVLPVRTAGMMCQLPINIGQFHGVIEPMTPIGLRCSSIRPSAVSWTTSTGSCRSAVACVQATVPPTSKREPRPLSCLPCSAVIRCASSSACSSTFLAIAWQTACRSASAVTLQVLNARAAAATASSRSCGEPSGMRPTTSNVEGFLTSW